MPSFENSLNLSSSSKRKNIPDGMWNRCEVCGDITFSKELNRNFKICPKCGYHYPMSTDERIRMLIPSKNFTEYKSNIKIHSAKSNGGSRSKIPQIPLPPLEKGDALYQRGNAKPRLSDKDPAPRSGQVGTGRLSAAFGSSPSALVTAGEAKLYEYQLVLCIINSNPIDGSNTGFNLNKTEYEKILYTFNNSLMKSLPLITFYADGTIVNLKSEYATPICESGNIERNGITRGESADLEWLSFIVSINLAATVEKLSQKGIPHITVLMNPRVSSEFSTSFPLGDIVLAEPKPVNPKSIDKKNSTITKNISPLQLLPENYLIDRYVNRRDLKKTLTKILSFCIG